MPLFLKIILFLAILWLAVYSTSYALSRFRKKEHKSGICAFVLTGLMIAVFIVFCGLPFFP